MEGDFGKLPVVNILSHTFKSSRRNVGVGLQLVAELILLQLRNSLSVCVAHKDVDVVLRAIRISFQCYGNRLRGPTGDLQRVLRIVNTRGLPGDTARSLTFPFAIDAVRVPASAQDGGSVYLSDVQGLVIAQKVCPIHPEGTIIPIPAATHGVVLELGLHPARPRGPILVAPLPLPLSRSPGIAKADKTVLSLPICLLNDPEDGVGMALDDSLFVCVCIATSVAPAPHHEACVAIGFDLVPQLRSVTPRAHRFVVDLNHLTGSAAKVDQTTVHEAAFDGLVRPV